MATVTKRVGAFDGEAVVFEYDYDDTSLFVTAVRCRNQSLLPAWASATDLVRNRTYERSWPAQATTEQAIPTGQANRLELVFDGRGVSNISFSMRWPE